MRKTKPWILHLACLTLATASTAWASDSYPDKPVHWIIPNAAGGGTDAIARLIAQHLSPELGQPVIIENRPGGSSIIGATALARSKPDGYTMLTGDNATFATNPHFYEKMGYDPEKDFSYVSHVARFPLLLVTRPDFPVNDGRTFISHLKENALTYATPGTGLPHHLASELLLQETGAQATHVPYRGSPAALMDLNAGRIDFMFVDLASGKAFIQDGRVKPLAAATTERLAEFPEVPTMKELGFDTFEVYAWQGVVVPKDTPAATVARLNQALAAAIDAPGVRERMSEIGVEPNTSTPEELAGYAAQESQRWGELIRSRGLKID